MLQFVKQFFVYGCSSVLAKVVATFLLPLYTNALSQEEFGALSLIVAIKGVIDLVSNLNIHSGVAREYNEKGVDRDKLVSTGFYSILFFSALTYVFFYITQGFWVSNVLGVHGYESSFRVMLLTIPAGSLFSYFGILTRIQQKALMFSLGHLLQLITQISLTIYFVLFARVGIIGVLYGILIGECVGILFLLTLNRKHLKKAFSTDLLRVILAYSLPTLPAVAAGWVDRSLGQVLIGKYVSVADVGVYSVALRITSVLLLFQVTLSQVWLPYVYENYKKPGFWIGAKKLYSAAILVLIALSVNVSMMSEWIVLALSNKNYHSASLYVSMLMISTSLAIVSNFVDIGPRLTRKTRYISQGTIIGSLCNIGLLFVLVPRFGVITVPLSLAASRLVSYMLKSYYTRQQVSVTFPHKYVLILIIGVLLTILAKQLIHSFILLSLGLVATNAFIAYHVYTKFDLKKLLGRVEHKRSDTY